MRLDDSNVRNQLNSNVLAEFERMPKERERKRDFRIDDDDCCVAIIEYAV